jgi:hypothetical protein
MMSDAFLRLHPFRRISEYRYIGFGSIYFSDFQIMHRVLGVNDMLSIEKDSAAAECFKFNRPYKAIELKFGYSHAVLPELDWSNPSILWLDYDGKLNSDVLADIDTFCARATSGSVLAISVNAQQEPEPGPASRLKIEQETGETFDLDRYRLKVLVDAIGDKIPPGTKGSMLRRDGLARVFHKVILNEVATELTTRNALAAPNDRMQFEQVLNFEYQDGARMLTVAGVLVNGSDSTKFDACAFDKLEFFRAGDEAYEINVPCLTPREVRHLNAQLPCASKDLKAPGVPAQDLESYARIYRFFPSFSELLLP